MAVYRLDVIQSGTGDPVVVVQVNDCRASCISLRGRKWDDPETIIKSGEYTFGISPNTEVDGQFTRRLGVFQGTIEERKPILIDRSKREQSFVYMPMPGTNPKKKRARNRPLETAVHDEPSEDSALNLLRHASDRLNAIVNGPTE